MKIGIPRALLYYRYNTLWETFFHELGMDIVTSRPTDRSIMEAGEYYAIDENCLSSKLFFGHISSLEGKCDAVFVPRISNFGNDGIFCTRFEALYDMCINIFKDTDIHFITCNVDIWKKSSESSAYIKLGVQLGKTRSQSRRAWQTAYETWLGEHQKYINSEVLKLSCDKIKILVVGHPYNIYDEYIGKPIINGIKKLDAVPIYADAVDHKRAQTDYVQLCRDIPWMMSRELVGSIVRYHDFIDGIILLTAFPCGPDSMVNEMIIHRVKDLPILNLLLDSQSGDAGIETRLESFIDIIRFRREMAL